VGLRDKIGIDHREIIGGSTFKEGLWAEIFAQTSSTGSRENRDSGSRHHFKGHGMGKIRKINGGPGYE